jgi:CheY-like chemotaxis protein
LTLHQSCRTLPATKGDVLPAFIAAFPEEAPAVTRIPTRVLLIVDDPMQGGILAQHLTAKGHEVYRARDTMEARWIWTRNFFNSVIVCIGQDGEGASGFVKRIQQEAPHQEITVLTPSELLALLKKPPVSVMGALTEGRGARPTGTSRKILQMSKRQTQ